MPPLAAVWFVAVLAMCVPALAAELAVVLETPEAGARVGSRRAFVSGRALARAQSSGRFDVIVVVDTSYSASAPSGADVDGDGRTGRRWGSPFIPILPRLLFFPNTDPGDSVLACEVEAARTLLEQLDPSETRVGIISFAGDRRAETRDARVEVPLTSNYTKVARGLERILAEGPRGQTNIYDALELATTELVDPDRSLSELRADAARIMLFMTDGQPTLPIPRARMDNARLALSAAAEAAVADVRIDSFAIGEGATDDPFVTEGMARETGGVYTPVGDPRDLVAAFRNVKLASIDRVEVENNTTGVPAEFVLVEPDGRFSALVDLADGMNELEVHATARDGARGTQGLRVELSALADSAALSVRLQERKTRTLRAQLAWLRERSLVLELEHADEQLRALEREIAAVRAEQSLQVEIAIDRP